MLKEIIHDVISTWFYFYISNWVMLIRALQRIKTLPPSGVIPEPQCKIKREQNKARKASKKGLSPGSEHGMSPMTAMSPDGNPMMSPGSLQEAQHNAVSISLLTVTYLLTVTTCRN